MLVLRAVRTHPCRMIALALALAGGADAARAAGLQLRTAAQLDGMQQPTAQTARDDAERQPPRFFSPDASTPVAPHVMSSQDLKILREQIEKTEAARLPPQLPQRVGARH